MPDDSQYRIEPSRRPLAAVVLMMMSRISARAARQLQLRALGRLQESIEVRIEIVNPAVDDARGVEDAVAAMDHVIVERNHHQCRIGDDAAELARVERRVLDRLLLAQRAQLCENVCIGEDFERRVSGRHDEIV